MERENGMSQRIKTMKKETQIGDEFILKGESEKGSPICYIKAYVHQKYPYVVVMHRKDKYGKERTLSWDWAKLILDGAKIGKK